MKELLTIWWFISICIAWIQGGFWWILLNIFIPLAPAMELAKFILNLNQ